MARSGAAIDTERPRTLLRSSGSVRSVFHPAAEVSRAFRVLHNTAQRRTQRCHIVHIPLNLGQNYLTMLTADLPDQIDSILAADVVVYSTSATFMG